MCYETAKEMVAASLTYSRLASTWVYASYVRPTDNIHKDHHVIDLGQFFVNVARYPHSRAAVARR